MHREEGSAPQDLAHVPRGVQRRAASPGVPCGSLPTWSAQLKEVTKWADFFGFPSKKST